MENMGNAMVEVKKHLTNMEHKCTDQMSAFFNLMGATFKPGAIPSKYKWLTGIAFGCASGCTWCISKHVLEALKVGATEEEILESCWVAVVMSGGGAMMNIQLVQTAINELKEKYKGAIKQSLEELGLA